MIARLWHLADRWLHGLPSVLIRRDPLDAEAFGCVTCRPCPHCENRP